MALSMIAGLAGAGLNLLGGIGSYYSSKANAALVRAQGRINNAVAQANAEAIEMSGRRTPKLLLITLKQKQTKKCLRTVC